MFLAEFEPTELRGKCFTVNDSNHLAMAVCRRKVLGVHNTKCWTKIIGKKTPLYKVFF